MRQREVEVAHPRVIGRDLHIQIAYATIVHDVEAVGDADRITSARATREFAARAKDRCTLKIWNSLYHELHNEPEQNQVLAYMLDWMQSYS